MVSYSIGITTYAARFSKYLVPLVTAIKDIHPNVEIIIAANGEKDSFDEQYRKNILSFASKHEFVYITTNPRFRTLAKLWNTCLVNSTNHNVLILNDDVTVSREFFRGLDIVIDNSDIKEHAPIFKINGSWSHSFLNRIVVDSIGWFDERYLGIGEEDGDFEWRLGKKIGYSVPNIAIGGIVNHVDHNDCLSGMAIANSKYSLFNYNFAFNTKYTECCDGESFGIMNRRLKCISETPQQYGCESFYWRHNCEL